MDSGTSGGNGGEDKRSNEEFVLKHKKAREPLKSKVARKQPMSDEDWKLALQKRERIEKELDKEEEEEEEERKKQQQKK